MYISSTDAYAIQDLDTLQDELSKHHPFESLKIIKFVENQCIYDTS